MTGDRGEPALATRVNRGLVWIGTASALVGLLDVVALLVILQRWVTPEEYGVATLCVWMFPILDLLTDLGLSGAIVQREERDQDRISTVFWINLLAATALFAVLFAAAPPLARRAGHEIVGWMLVAYGTKLVWQNVYFIPHAMLKRELRFRELSLVRIAANLAEFAGKIGFAAAGLGIWCFVLGPLCRVLVSGIGMQLCYPWRPRLVCRLAIARAHVAFGLRTSASQLLYHVYTNVDYPIVGAVFGERALGLYRIAYEVVLEPVRVLSEVVIAVAFPAFARLRDAREQLIAQLVTFVRLNVITVMTYAAVVAVTAPELLARVFPGYEDAATATRVLSVVGVLRAVGFVLPPLLDGLGHPGRTLRYMLCAALVLPACFVAGALALGPHVGFVAVAIAWAVGYPLAFGVLVWLATTTLGWSVRALAAALRGVLACVLAGAAAGAGLRVVLGPSPGALAAALAIPAVTLALLAWTQDLGPRALVRALRGR